MVARKKWLAVFVFVALAALLLSQLSSYLVTRNLVAQETRVVNSFLHLTFVQNNGGVFGAFQGFGWIAGVLSALVLTAVTAFILFGKGRSGHEYVLVGLVVGGGFSNVLDRSLRGFVVDFVDLQQIPYWNFVFNTADVFIHVGLWSLFFIALFATPQASASVRSEESLESRPL